MKIVSAAEMRDIDRVTSSKYKVPSLTLMENAGSAVAEYILQHYPDCETVGVICGKGNNGGDGFVAARHLHEAGKDVRVLLLAATKDLSGDAAKMLKKLPVKPVEVRRPADLKKIAKQVYSADLLVDALLGTGFRSPLSELYAQAIALFWKQTAPIISVDIPSGLEADAINANPSAPHVPASATITFTAAKPALVLADPGTSVVVAPIGSPEEAIASDLNLNVTTARDVALALPQRLPDSNKGMYGHVLVIGGSVGKAGAAAMAGMAALRAGAGLVTVAAPKSVVSTVASFAPELMTEPLSETAEGTISLACIEHGKLDRVLRGKTLIALGPGLSQHPETVNFIRVLVSNCRLPLVIDADGLNAFQGMAEKLNGRLLPQLVLTPHPGEMARLAGTSVAEVQADRIGVVRRFARERAAIVVLKGHRTLTALPDGRVWVNSTGNPALAKGGTGDILTGIIAGLMAQQAPHHAGLSMDVTEEKGKKQTKTLLRKAQRSMKKNLAYQLTDQEAQWLAPRLENLRQLSREREALGDVLPVIAAVYLHGLAGDLARDALDERAVLATDLIAHLAGAFRETRIRAADKFVRIS
jgi:NAD(P)H-hydrate epimerase